MRLYSRQRVLPHFFSFFPPRVKYLFSGFSFYTKDRIRSVAFFVVSYRSQFPAIDLSPSKVYSGCVINMNSLKGRYDGRSAPTEKLCKMVQAQWFYDLHNNSLSFLFMVISQTAVVVQGGINPIVSLLCYRYYYSPIIITATIITRIIIVPGCYWYCLNVYL